MGEHVPVLFEETIQSLAVKDGGTYVDLTLGRAGHSSKILSLIPHGHLYGFDLDPVALEEGKKKLEGIGSNFTLIHDRYETLADRLGERGVDKVDGILADLGVSSPQFDDPERGFSYRYDARLDMRMDPSSPLTAYDVVNSYSFEELLRVFNEYGEDKDSFRIAKAICKARTSHEIVTTFDLVEVVKSAKSAKTLAQKGHPAKQTFQALRIEVNGEEKSLETMLEIAPSLLKAEGRLSIITFMSLDDRKVKKAFRALSEIQGSREGPAILPGQVEKPAYRELGKKPVVPSEKELSENPRAASAKLRTLIRNP